MEITPPKPTRSQKYWMRRKSCRSKFFQAKLHNKLIQLHWFRQALADLLLGRDFFLKKPTNHRLIEATKNYDQGSIEENRRILAKWKLLDENKKQV